MKRKLDVKDFKEQLTTEIRKKIHDLFLNCETASLNDIQKAYIEGARMTFNEMVGVSTKLPEHMAEQILTIFNQVIEEYK